MRQMPPAVDNNTYTPVTRAALDLLRDVLGPCNSVLSDPTTEELMINTGSDVWAVTRGRTVKTDIEIAPARLSAALRAVAALNDREVVEKNGNAILNTVLDGNRIAACLQSVATRGDMMCIRLPRKERITLKEYKEQGFFNPRARPAADNLENSFAARARGGGDALVDYLAFMIRQRKSFLVAGSTATGKTSFLNLLLEMVPPHERIVCCEDTLELRIANENHVRLLEDPVNGIRLPELVAFSLRLRPDRIVCGEARGAEALHLIGAFHTGHPGFGSLHADSARGVFSRLEQMMRLAGRDAPSSALRSEIAQAVDVIVFIDAPYDAMTKSRTRFILEVLRVHDYENEEFKTETVYSAYGAAD